MRNSGWLAVTLLLGSGLTAPMAWGQERGDLNSDGQITQVDVTILQGYLQGQGFLSDGQITAADLNGDGRVTSADLARLTSLTGSSEQPDIRLDSASAGRVIDRATGQPLSNVEIAIPGAGISVRSDAQGRFQLPSNIPSDQILLAKLDNYLPYSQTTDGELKLNVQLDRWDAQSTLVLQSDVVHLGDDRYSAQSAGASQFRLRTQGTELLRSFDVNSMPRRDPILRIGSLIGLDTAEAVRAGQSRIPGADMSPLRVFLNGTPVQSIVLGGNDLTVLLPRRLVQMGENTVLIRTGMVQGVVQQTQIGIPLPFLGGLFQVGIPIPNAGMGILVDHDDVELANVVIELDN